MKIVAAIKSQRMPSVVRFCKSDYHQYPKWKAEGSRLDEKSWRGQVDDDGLTSGEEAFRCALTNTSSFNFGKQRQESMILLKNENNSSAGYKNPSLLWRFCFFTPRYQGAESSMDKSNKSRRYMSIFAF